MPFMWTPTTQLALVAVIVAIATTIALLLRARRRLNNRFAAFAISIAAYYLTAMVASILASSHIQASDIAVGIHIIPFFRVLSGSAIIITSTIFFDAILGEAGIRARRRRRKTMVAGFLMGFLGFALLFPLSVWVAKWMQGMAAAVTVILLGARATAVFRKTSEVETQADRMRLRYLAYGGIGALIGFLCDLGAIMGWPIPPIGGLVVAVYLYFISQALLMSRLLDLHELLSKGLIFGTLALILAVVYGAVVVWAGDRPGFFLFNTLIASGLILILFDPLRTYLEEATTRLFFREQMTFSRSVREATRRLATIIQLPQAVDEVLDAVYDTKRATHASVYFLDHGGLSFTLQGFRGPKPHQNLDAKQHPALFHRVVQQAGPLLRDALVQKLRQLQADPFADEDSTKEPLQTSVHEESILEGLNGLKADLLVPLRTENQTVGLVALRDERLQEAYASDEIAAVQQIADQLTINVENSRLFNLIREKDRLAALGEMSAGLAHEIRNPLAAIKGAAQELDPKRLPEGIDNEMMEIIVTEVNRLNTVVSGFLDYARPFQGTFSALSPNDVVERTIQLMSIDLPKEVNVELDLDKTVHYVNGDAQQLQQVMINLFLNAVDAIERQGEVSISTRVTEEQGRAFGVDSRFVEITIRDTGPGIPASVRENLFIPFYTTKERGTGLGLALCQRIVEHHGGSIEVRSAEGRGATFIVRLPALVPRDKSSKINEFEVETSEEHSGLVPVPNRPPTDETLGHLGQTQMAREPARAK
jgi:two-component system, NtrC family, sensor histidine kinase HydH